MENQFRNKYTNVIIDSDYILNIISLSKLKFKYNVKIILVAHDDEYLLNFQTIFFSKISDHILTTDVVSINRFRQLNKKVSFLHPPLEFRKNNKKKPKYDVTFVGATHKPGRSRFLNFLKKKKFLLKYLIVPKKEFHLKKCTKYFKAQKLI